MKARVFFDAFSECLAGMAMARRYAGMHDKWRAEAVRAISARHGDKHAEAAGRMFDRLFSEMQNPEGRQ
jgi:hypothetical protein